MPRLRIPLPWLTGLLLPSSVTGRIIAGFGLLVIILIVVVSGSAWLVREHQSALAKTNATAATAVELEEARFNGTLALLLLDRYLLTGNEQIVPVIRSSLAVLKDSLAEAHDQEQARGDSGVPGVDDDAELEDLRELQVGAAVLSDTFEQVIALRQSGDEEGASQLLEGAVADITAFGSLILATADAERGEILDLQSQADRTADLAFRLLVLSGVGGAALGLAASVFIARSILKPLSSVEAVALAVAGGNLEARAQPSGPKELARLGASLNRMTESLLGVNRSLEEKVRELETEVTERKQAEEALRGSEETFRTLYTKTPAMVHSIGPDGNLLAVSGRWLEVFGYERNEVIGRKSVEFLTAESRQYAETVSLPEFWKRGWARDVAYQFVRKNGEIVDVLLSAVVQRDLEGNILRTLAVLDDITERKQAEETLRESEGRLRDMFEAGLEGLVIHENGAIVDVNPAFEQMSGYQRSELIGMPVLDLAAQESRDSIAQRLREPLGAMLEAVGLSKDGARLHVEIVGRDHTYRGQPMRMVALRDVTERKQAEEALQQAREALEGRVERKLLQKNPYGLTFREFTVLHHIAAGKANKEIALELGISPLTVHKHVANILGKMNASSRTEAAAHALRAGLLD